MSNKKETINFKIQTPAYNASSTVKNTVKSSKLNNTPPIWGLTQIRDVKILEDNYNLFSEEQKEKVRLLVSLTGNGDIENDVPPYQTGRYVLKFDDFTSISFMTGFDSNYGFGNYKYTGLANNFGEYKIADIEWNAQASGNQDFDNWNIILYKL